MRRLQTSHFLVLAIDLPRMKLEHLLKLFHLATPKQGVILRNRDHLEPLCAIYPLSSAEVVEKRLRSLRASMQDLCEELQLSAKANFYDIKPEEIPL
jgi:molybdopterin-guanine dinucleotide biosynthesis protein A